MIYYANKLSQEFVFVRVDFYEIDNRIYLGELTVSPTNSFIKWKNYQQNKKVGEFIPIISLLFFFTIIN